MKLGAGLDSSKVKEQVDPDEEEKVSVADLEQKGRQSNQNIKQLPVLGHGQKISNGEVGSDEKEQKLIQILEEVHYSYENSEEQ